MFYICMRYSPPPPPPQCILLLPFIYWTPVEMDSVQKLFCLYICTWAWWGCSLNNFVAFWLCDSYSEIILLYYCANTLVSLFLWQGSLNFSLLYTTRDQFLRWNLMNVFESIVFSLWMVWCASVNCLHFVIICIWFDSNVLFVF